MRVFKFNKQKKIRKLAYKTIKMAAKWIALKMVDVPYNYKIDIGIPE